MLQGDEQQTKGKLVLKKGKVYVPKDKKLRVEIIWLHHDVLVTGHRGRWKTTELVMRNYWQPRVTRNVRRYVEEYDMCQRMKDKTKVLAGKLKLSKVLEKLQIYLIVDFIIKLLIVAGKDIILVVCDRLFKITYFVAIIKETLAEELICVITSNLQSEIKVKLLYQSEHKRT